MLARFLSKFHHHPPYRWNIEVFNGHAVRGWVTNLENPGSPTLVAAFRRGRAVSAFVSTVARDDLIEIGYGSAAFTLVLTDAPRDGIDIAVINPAQRGRWITIVQSLRPPVGVGVVDAIRGNKVVGWAACFEPNSREFFVVFRSGGEVVARSRPSLLRSDAAASLMLEDGLLGFEVKLPWRRLAFESLAVTGEIGEHRFPIADLVAQRSLDSAFAQSFSYAAETQFWA